MVGTFSRTTGTAEALDATLAEHPDVAANLRAAHDAAWAVVDADLLELCRLRIAQLLGNDAELAVRTPAAGVAESTIEVLSSWPTAPAFGPRERACLELCEQSIIDVANVSADQTAAVAAHLGDQGLADFVSALLVLEQRQRLRLTWARLFPDRAQGDADGP